MDCEELMVKQVDLTVGASPGTKVFVCKKCNKSRLSLNVTDSDARADRNMIKALPWFTSVRKKLTDPAYSRWFMVDINTQAFYIIENLKYLSVARLLFSSTTEFLC
eukprot:SAG31_NODE_258_length_18937_cov_61.688555_12_plen_106_part_00